MYQDGQPAFCDAMDSASETASSVPCPSSDRSHSVRQSSSQSPKQLGRAAPGAAMSLVSAFGSGKPCLMLGFASDHNVRPTPQEVTWARGAVIISISHIDHIHCYFVAARL